MKEFMDNALVAIMTIVIVVICLFLSSVMTIGTALLVTAFGVALGDFWIIVIFIISFTIVCVLTAGSIDSLCK